MRVSPLLQNRLKPVAERQQQLALWCKLAACWAGVALAGLVVIGAQRSIGWTSSLTLPLIALLGLALSAVTLVHHRRVQINWRELALRIEARYPELDGALLTAVEQEPRENGQFNFLQERLFQQIWAHGQQNDWMSIVPPGRLALARVAHLVALVLFAVVLWDMRSTGGHSLLTRVSDNGVEVIPGDVSLERGNSLVVLTRFTGALPPTVELVYGANGEGTNRIALVKSLADPVFGGSVTEVLSNLVYHIEYPGHHTRDFKVTVFEHPRLQRPDVDLTFPEYTGQPPKHIQDTRRISAVEGSMLELTLQLNKPVVSALLVPRDKESPSLSLAVETNRPLASLKQLSLQKSKSYELRLVDAEGRTNKVPALFVFDVLTNRIPELKIASPRGDVRPSLLEEINFEGTVWDDFGIQSFGLGYTIAGQETKFVELGHAVPAKEKQSFQHLLRLEDLTLQPDQLLAWFVWADDTGPDGQVRRTSGDLYFAEIRPFDEIFREGGGMDGQSGQSGQQSQSAKLTELQKQIINATWRLQRDHSSKAAPSDSKSNSPARNGRQSSLRGSWPIANDQPPARMKVGTFFGMPAEPESQPAPRSRGSRLAGSSRTNASPAKYEDDIIVVRDSQAQALEQAEAASERQQDPRTSALWSAATKEMEKSLASLNRATNSPASLPEALKAQQGASQALLKLQQHEYQVSRSRSQGGSGGSGQQMQRQLEQMEMTQSENRYETQRQAQKPQNAERNEQLQVVNRLQELARRQQDLNDRLKELQTALQEARTEQEREEIKRRLKRLQEEEQQMLADVDELRQRMERPENQSRMAEERKQLEDTRQDVQRAAEAAGEGSASQALASGTRAQRQLQEMRDQMRKESSSQFADDLREMRNQAREMARQQEDLLKKMDQDTSKERKSLSDSAERKEMLEQLARQRERMTNIVDRATEISQQAEEAEPLLSRQLYDTLRKFNQDTGKNLKETQEDLLNRRLMSESLYDRLKDASAPDGAKLLDITSEMLKLDFLRQATEVGQRTGASIEELKRGVERAAESVLGDDTEALRLAQQQLNQVMDQLEQEMAKASGAGAGTNRPSGNSAQASSGQGATTNEFSAADGRQSQRARSGRGSNEVAQAEGQNGQGQNSEQQSAQANSGQNDGQRKPGNQPGTGNQPGQETAQSSQSGQSQPGQSPGEGQGEGQGQGRQGQQGQSEQAQSAEGNNREGNRQAGNNQQGGARRGGAQSGGRNSAGGDGWADGANWDGGSLGRDWNRLFDPSLGQAGPILGDGYASWSDRLRDVEEMIDAPDLRNEVAKARERARLTRQEFKRDLKKPDWAVVRLQVLKPLVEVRDRIADELARRNSNDALVPIDRDPVPTRYSDLVRKYYEELGRDK